MSSIKDTFGSFFRGLLGGDETEAGEPENLCIIHDMSFNQWGNSIAWLEVEAGTVYGFLTPRPSIGDCILCKMHSGNIGIFQFTEIKYMTDPKDQFFGVVKFVRYATPGEALMFKSRKNPLDLKRG